MKQPTRKPKRTNWRQRAESAEAQVEQLIGDIKAVSQDYTDAKRALDAAEARNAELLREREARASMAVTWEQLPPAAKERITREILNSRGQLKPSWLRRNWVELTVMATVLGAIGFVVLRAWH